ncbi:MAG TPA: serine--tRNA ligase [Candidatus Marinimicrobia bacterium]|nr:serine--tRNA ligase [Candidatus Neomarinimicrobiota bacterium]HRS51668.1 serine--tRNA ligase [Candidatus Neomarinimicrobiota bacterium]HRU92182.1 serine--tRNA ligase [Candidatus Neomarinimicrobiota bacterium]
MLDLKQIRNEPEKYRRGLEAKNAGDKLTELLLWDSERRKCINQADELKATRNRVSDEIGQLKKMGLPAEEKILEMRSVGDQISALDHKLKEIDEKINSILVTLPNLPHPSVKIGKSSADNVTIKQWGHKPEFDFPLKDHLDLSEALGILDMKRAAKISGTGFPMYVGDGATLERALVNFMLDFHRNYHGYQEVFPPFMVTRNSAFGTGQLPKLEEDMYRIETEDLFMIPTAEVPVTNIHRDEILPENRLPIKYAAYSACFRREAGSYGKDTRGLSRVHQFNKVELVWFTTPENSYIVHEQILRDAEDILQALNLHYRVVELCSADLSFAAAKCYDIEVWAPGSSKYFEVSSVSNFEDFQARRANIRYRRTSDNKLNFVHTLNGSGVATPRLMIALLETCQTPEGTIIIPQVLQKYTGFNQIRTKK